MKNARLYSKPALPAADLAPIFAALGDETRIALVETLRLGYPQSISQLTAETRLSRQAVTKHLRILQNAGLIRAVKVGRERMFEFEPAPIEELTKYLRLAARTPYFAAASEASHT